MQCEINLTEAEISALVGYLLEEDTYKKYEKSYLPDEKPKYGPEEMEGIFFMAESYKEDKNHIRVFGDNYTDIYNNARKHVVDCESCNHIYREVITKNALSMLSGKRRLSPMIFSPEFIKSKTIEGEVKNLDARVLNLY